MTDNKWNKIGIAKLHTNGSYSWVLVSKKPPKNILKKIADLLNSYIDCENGEFIDTKYFDVEV